MNYFLNSFDKDKKDLSKKASMMYQMLRKIASNKEVWTLGEVRRLLSRISPKNNLDCYD